MSQPSTDMEADLEFDAPDFGEASFEEADSPVAATPVVPAAPRYKKQGFSIYTIMLMLSFLCLLAGLIMMFVEAGKYN